MTLNTNKIDVCLLEILQLGIENYYSLNFKEPSVIILNECYFTKIYDIVKSRNSNLVSVEEAMKKQNYIFGLRVIVGLNIDEIEIF